MKPDNETLMAFADGALPDEDMQRIEALIAKDADLAAIVARHRALRQTVQAAYAAEDVAPLSDGLAELMAGIEQDVDTSRAPAGVTSLNEARTRRLPGRAASSHYWPLAAAACLVIGIAGGLLAPSVTSSSAPSQTYIAWQDGAPIAGKQLASALSTQISSNTDQSVSISASFIAESGVYCRQFTIEGQPLTGGIACKSDEAWQLVALSALHSSGDYQAAGDAPDPLAAAALHLGVKKKLSPKEEAEQISSGWIPQD